MKCVYCQHEQHHHAGAPLGCRAFDGDDECGCPTFRSEPLPPPSLSDLELRLTMRRERLKRLKQLNAPEVIITNEQKLVDQAEAAIRERTPQ